MTTIQTHNLGFIIMGAIAATLFLVGIVASYA